MAGQRTLTTSVWVLDDNGNTVQCKAGQSTDDLGALAEKITNPHVWSEPAAMAAEPDPDPEERTDVEPTLAPGGNLPDPEPEPTPPPPVDQPVTPKDQIPPPPTPGDSPDMLPPSSPPAGSPHADEAPPADPAAQPEEPAEPADNIPAESDVPTGTVDEVLEWVGEDPDKAKVALTVENRKTRPRVTLLAELEDIASDAN